MAVRKKQANERHETKHAANQHLIGLGFSFSRQAKPPRWYHADGRQAVVQPTHDGAFTVEYRDAEALDTRVWEHADGSWRWTVRRHKSVTFLGEGTAASEAEAQALLQAIVSTTRLHTAKGRARKARRRRRRL